MGATFTLQRFLVAPFAQIIYEYIGSGTMILARHGKTEMTRQLVLENINDETFIQMLIWSTHKMDFQSPRDKAFKLDSDILSPFIIQHTTNSEILSDFTNYIPLVQSRILELDNVILWQRVFKSSALSIKDMYQIINAKAIKIFHIVLHFKQSNRNIVTDLMKRSVISKQINFMEACHHTGNVDYEKCIADLNRNFDDEFKSERKQLAIWHKSAHKITYSSFTM